MKSNYMMARSRQRRCLADTAYVNVRWKGGGIDLHFRLRLYRLYERIEYALLICNHYCKGGNYWLGFILAELAGRWYKPKISQQSKFWVKV